MWSINFNIMKKLFLLLLFLPLLLIASQKEYEVKILFAITDALFPNSNVVKVWTDTKENVLFLQNVKKVQTVSTIEESDLLFISKNNDIQSDKMKFVTSYQLLKRYKKSALGGFYWKKGRPNILFIKENLLKYKKKLPESMDKYIEDEF